MSMKKPNYMKLGMWYIFGNLLIKGISFFTLPIFTRLLSTGDFGKFNLFLSYENILNVVLGLGVAGTIKTAYLDFKDEFEKYFGFLLSLLFMFSIGTHIIVNLVMKIFGYGGTFWDVKTVNLLLLASLATALYNVISMKFVISASYKKNLSMSLVYTVSSIGLSLVFCYAFFSNQKYMGRILGNAIPLIVITYVLAVKSIVKGKCLWNNKYWKYAATMGIPLIFHSLSFVLMQQVDKIMVHNFCGDELTGIYSLACNISLILTIVQSSIDNSWAPWFYPNLDEKKYGLLVEKNGQLVYLFSYLTIGFNLISPELVKLASPETYSSAIYVLIPLNLAVYASFMYMFAVNKEYYYKKTKMIAVGTIIATVLHILLNIILIPRFGFISAAYATFASKIVLFGIHWHLSRKIDKNNVVNMKKLLLSFAAVSLVGLISMLLREKLVGIVIRYFIIVIISVIGYLYIKKNSIKINIFKGGNT